MLEQNITVSIDGSQLSTFTSFTLDQKINDHHSFELVVGHDIIEELGSHVMDSSKNWIGKSFTVMIGDNQFSGIVFSVRMAHFHGLNGDLIVSGFSPTKLLEAGPHKQSWNEQSLAAIVEEVIGAGGVPASVSPAFSGSIEYMAQYRESHWEFLKRMAGQYHEWLFYDGTTLNFGNPGGGGEVPLVYGIDLDKVEIGIQMAPTNYGTFSYQAGRDETFASSAGATPAGLNDLGSHAFGESQSAYSIESKSSLLRRVSDKSQLDEAMDKKRAAAAANLATVKGTGTKPDLRPGVVVSLEAAINEGGSWSNKPYGSFLVTSVTHVSTGNHQYINNFEAIPAGVEVLPEPKWRMPVAEPQVATVLSNADPDKQGRVQVKMLWQDGGMMSPWVRVMTPDAGSSDLHGKNRGFVFIPEEGDQVMVGFRYNDPNKPYVMGSLYHGMTGEGGKDGNVMRSIITKGGHVVELDDTVGGESIVITDKNGNSITIDTTGNSISINAMDSISLKAPNSITLAAMNINAIAGATMNIQATASYNLNTANMMQNVSMAAMLRAKDLTNFVKNNFTSTAKNINQTASDSINSKAKDKIVLSAKKKLDQRAGKMDLTTQKGKLRLKAKGNAEIKGKVVKNN